MSLTIRRLRTFIAVAESQSFSRAAEELASSQPALTAHIKELETYLGVALLNRTTRRVTLTSEGELLLARAKRSLGEIDGVVDEIRQHAALQQGRVAVGCTPSIAMSLLPQALKDFRRAHPRIDILIFDEASDALEHRLLASEIDFAVGPSWHRPTGLAFQHLINDPFMAICSTEHPLATLTSISLAELAQHPLIMMRQGVSMRQEIEQAFAEHRLTCPPPTIEVLHHYTVMALAEAGLGFGLLPRMTVLMLQRRDLRVMKIVSPEVSREFGITVRKGEAVSTPSKLFIESFLRTADHLALLDMSCE